MTGRQAAKLYRLARREDGWWIVGIPPEMGPYDVKADAVEDMHGCKRFYCDNYGDEECPELDLFELDNVLGG